MAALGLSLSDLFAQPLSHHRPPSRSRIPAREALATLEHESSVVAIIGADFLVHRSIDEPTWTRLTAAVQRIGTTRTQCEFR